MKRWMRLGCLFCSIGVAGFAVAQNPFVGTWKLNQGKSHLTGGTMRFSSAGNGMIRETIAEGSYTFKTDGQSYPSLFGDTENWKKLSGHSWQSTVHMNGGYVSTDTLNVSDDGKSLTVTSTGTHPDGSAFHDTIVYTRTAGGNGLMGTWKNTSFKSSSPGALEFAANGDDGLTWKLPQIKATLNAKFDGKDYTPDGPTVPKGLTLALTRNGVRSFRIVEKVNGKPIYKARYSVSSDGKTLTEVGMPVGQTEAETAVYDKQ